MHDPQRAEEHSTAMRALQKELDDLRELRQRDIDQARVRAQEDEDELRMLRDRCDILEDEKHQQQPEVCLIVSASF